MPNCKGCGDDCKCTDTKCGDNCKCDQGCNCSKSKQHGGGCHGGGCKKTDKTAEAADKK